MSILADPRKGWLESLQKKKVKVTPWDFISLSLRKIKGSRKSGCMLVFGWGKTSNREARDFSKFLGLEILN